MFYLSLFGKFVKIRWRSQLEYPTAFILGILAQWASYGFQFLTMWIMIQTFGTLAEWKPMEVLFLYSMNLLSYGIGATFVFNISREVPSMARNGSFDDVLIKPINSLVYMLSANINVGYVSHISLSITVMIISLHSLGIIMTFTKSLWMLLTLIGSAMIHGGAMLLTTVPSLFILADTGWDFLYWGMRDFQNYPLSVFGRPLQLIFTFVLPYAFINFYPAQPFLLKSDTLMFPMMFQYLTPLIGLLLVTLAALVWRWGINRYESTGS